MDRFQAVSEAERIARVYEGYKATGPARWSQQNRGNQAIFAERQGLLLKLLGESNFLPLASRNVLEIGCGSEGWLPFFLASGAPPSNLMGVDILPQRIEEARAAFPGVEFAVANAERLQFSESSFDLIMFSTVFSSILDPAIRCRVALEAARVLRPGGAIIWYDFRVNNPWNSNVLGIDKKEIARLFPSLRLILRSVTVFPPLVRRLGWATDAMYKFLKAWPIMRTHYLGLLLKPAR